MKEREEAALREIAILAGTIVLESPEHSTNTMSYVRRALLKQLEEALVTAGYDMAAARRHVKAWRAIPREEGRVR